MHLKLFCLVAGHFPLWGGGFVWLAPFGARFGAASVWGGLHLTKYFFFLHPRLSVWALVIFLSEALSVIAAQDRSGDPWACALGT